MIQQLFLKSCFHFFIVHYSHRSSEEEDISYFVPAEQKNFSEMAGREVVSFLFFSFSSEKQSSFYFLKESQNYE